MLLSKVRSFYLSCNECFDEAGVDGVGKSCSRGIHELFSQYHLPICIFHWLSNCLLIVIPDCGMLF